MDLELQSRTPKHGLGRDHPKTAAGHGCVTSASQPHQKWGDYRIAITVGLVSLIRSEVINKMSYSLEGEDKIVESLLRKAKGGTYFDIGCADPIDISNTYLFYEKGWTGLCVDGRMDLAERWAVERPRDDFRCVLVGESNEDVCYFKFPDPTLNTCDASAAARYKARFSDNEVFVQSHSVRSGRQLWIDRLSNGGLGGRTTP